jgi:hypothetical protein
LKTDKNILKKAYVTMNFAMKTPKDPKKSSLKGWRSENLPNPEEP